MAGPVLLVHDDIAGIAAIRRLLARDGYEVILATNAADALIAFGHHLPALIVLSPTVEGHRGQVVLEELAQHPEARLARVLLLGETVPGFGAPVVPLPLDGMSFLRAVQEAIRAPTDADSWLVGDRPLAAAAAAPAIPDDAEPWRATAPVADPPELADLDPEGALEEPELEFQHATQAEPPEEPGPLPEDLEADLPDPGEARAGQSDRPSAQKLGAADLDEELEQLEREVHAEAALRHRRANADAAAQEPLARADELPEPSGEPERTQVVSRQALLEAELERLSSQPHRALAQETDAAESDESYQEAQRGFAAAEPEPLAAADLEQLAAEEAEWLAAQEAQNRGLAETALSPEHPFSAEELEPVDPDEAELPTGEPLAAAELDTRLGELDESRDPGAAPTQRVRPGSGSTKTVRHPVAHARRQERQQRDRLAPQLRQEQEPALAQPAGRLEQERAEEAEAIRLQQERETDEAAQSVRLPREPGEKAQARPRRRRKTDGETQTVPEQQERETAADAQAVPEPQERDAAVDAPAAREQQEREAAEDAQAAREQQRDTAEDDQAARERQERDAAEEAGAVGMRQERETAEDAQAAREQQREAGEEAGAVGVQQERDTAEDAQAAPEQQERETAEDAQAAREQQREAVEGAQAVRGQQQRQAAEEENAAQRRQDGAAGEAARALLLQQEQEAAEALAAARGRQEQEAAAEASRLAARHAELEQEHLRLERELAQARARADEASRIAEQERATRESEEKARQQAESALQGAREEARRLAAQAAPLQLEIPGRPAQALLRSGAAGREQLANLVVQLCRAGAEVRLELKSAVAARSIWLRQGIVVAATSSLAEESLLDRAWQDGLIDGTQEKELRLLRGASTLEQLKALRSRRYLRKPEEVPLLQRFTEQVVLEALSEPESLYRLSDDPAPEAAGGCPRPGLQLAVEALRRALHPEEVLGGLGGLNAIACPAPSDLDLDDLGFSDRERRLIKEADGQSTLEDLLLTSGVKQEVGLSALFVARALGLISVRPPPEPQPAAPAPEVDVHRLTSKYDQVQESDYFAILGLSRTAGAEEVERAFKLLAAEFHPLKFAGHPDGSLQHRAQAVHEVLAEAARALQDDRLRVEYARHLVD